MTGSHISLSNVGKRFGAHWAVKDLSFEATPGSFTALLGPSGCGKTTTLRMLAGFTRPDEGTIEVGGRVLSSSSSIVPPERRKMGMVFQQYAVWPHMTVHENIAFGLQLRKVKPSVVRDRVEACLSLVGLEGLGGRQPSELSGGQQQRVALGRALVVEPDILLLDEPLSNLDAKIRDRMRSELKAIQRRTGITFIYVTHDQVDALVLADEIMVMDDGRLLQKGTPTELYERPADQFVAEFFGLVNWLPGTIGELSAGLAWVELDGGSRVSAPPGEHEAGQRVRVAVRPEDLAVSLESKGGDNEVEARVTEARFLGPMIQYEMDAGSACYTVLSPRSVRAASGQRVYLTIPSESGCIQPDGRAIPGLNADGRRATAKV